MFLGDIRASHGRPDRMEDHLPEAPLRPDLNADLLRVFERGRTLKSRNDLTVSPVTAFMYRSLGDDGMRHALACARHMFDGTLSPLAFLQSLDPGVVRPLIQACARIAVSRRAALLALEEKFGQIGL
jgi:hypothetical protein